MSLLGLIGFLGIYLMTGVAASVRCLRSDYFGVGQKFAHLALIWGVPFIGAVFMWLFYKGLREPVIRSAGSFGGGANDSGFGPSGGDGD